MANHDPSWELIRKHLPSYLSAQQKEDLYQELRTSFPLSTDPAKMFTSKTGESTFLQGDGIWELPMTQWDSQEKRYVTTYFSASILSNTCDIYPENKRLIDPHVVVAAIFDLEGYLDFLRKRGEDDARIISFLDALKQNKISNLLYLPQRQNLLAESFIQFDFVSSFPISVLDKYDNRLRPDGDRFFTFSDYGFYLFLVKLSIHFCRLREGVIRSEYDS